MKIDVKKIERIVRVSLLILGGLIILGSIIGAAIVSVISK